MVKQGESLVLNTKRLITADVFKVAFLRGELLALLLLVSMSAWGVLGRWVLAAPAWSCSHIARAVVCASCSIRSFLSLPADGLQVSPTPEKKASTQV